MVYMITEHLHIEPSHYGWAHIGPHPHYRQLWLSMRGQALQSTGSVRAGDVDGSEHLRVYLLSDKDRWFSSLAGALLNVGLQLENLRGKRIRQNSCVHQTSELTAIFFSSLFA